MSSVYNVVMSPEYFGEFVQVQPGAFDHWAGETVPVRNENREIIGEARIVSVDHREDGQVWMIVESELDMTHHSIARVAGLLRGRAPMNIRIPEPDPHRPRRDDDVARWLKGRRDKHVNGDGDELPYYWAIDSLLDEYRARADYGLTLDDDITQLPEYGSGDYIARRDD